MYILQGPFSRLYMFTIHSPYVDLVKWVSVPFSSSDSRSQFDSYLICELSFHESSKRNNSSDKGETKDVLEWSGKFHGPTEIRTGA